MRERKGRILAPPARSRPASCPPLFARAPDSPPVADAQLSAAGGRRAGIFSHSPQCRRIFSMTSVWRRSMNAMMRIVDPHRGHRSGSDS
jgi:hypothetical protein